MLIPHTIFISNEIITDWFFTSKDGYVLRKHVKNLKVSEIFKSLLHSPEVYKAIEMLNSDKRRQISDEFLINKIENGIKDPHESDYIHALMETKTVN